MPGLHLPPLQRNQFVLVLSIFITLLSFNFVLPFLPLYMQELGVTDPQRAALWSGAMLSIAPLLSSLAALFWGALADRYGYKLMLQRALALFVFITVLMGLVRHSWQLFGLRAAHGLLGGFGALSMTLVTLTARKERVGEAISLVQSARVLGVAIGPVHYYSQFARGLPRQCRSLSLCDGRGPCPPVGAAGFVCSLCMRKGRCSGDLRRPRPHR
ncbi:MAG TPA: hypothetical protein DEP84_31860 [Chloroflexi bacterium]|nr:hypothetical protein [Chloroflexota bacterium]